MTTSIIPTHDIHPQLQSVARRLSAWRPTRQRGQRIPEDLWNAAVTLARSHGDPGKDPRNFSWALGTATDPKPSARKFNPSARLPTQHPLNQRFLFLILGA
jgi:hypothetical protein